MTLWMVRSASGDRLADEFVEKGLVAMGSARIASIAELPDKQAFREVHEKQRPDIRAGKHQAASQLN